MVPTPPAAARALLIPVLVGLLAALGPRPAAAQTPARGDGMFITVPNPITQDAVKQIQMKVTLAFERQERDIKTIVFDFNPKGLPVETSDFYQCQALADYIADLWLGRVKLRDVSPKINTIAFVHGEVSKHTVLPVLACAELVMAPESKIGDVLRGHEGRLPPAVESAYKDVARKSRWGDLVLRMLHPDLPIHKVQLAGGGTAFWSDATLKAKKEQGERFTQAAETPAWLDRGNSAFEAAQAVAAQLAKSVPADRAALADALPLPRHSLREDWLAGRTPVAWRIDVNGLDAGRLESLKRRIKEAVRHGANLIILQLSAEGGGDTAIIGDAARELAKLTNPSSPNPVTTVAYVPKGRSLGAATFLALGCTEIVMADSAVLGDFDYLKSQNAEALALKRDALVQLARDQGYPPLLFQATLDKGLVLYRARPVRGGAFQLITAADKQADEDRPQAKRSWDLKGRLQKNPGELLKIDAELAREWGVALKAPVESVKDLYELYKARYGMDPERVRVSGDSWQDRVAEFFREPVVMFFLIMIGIAGLILEFKMPGLGLPGVVAGVCFVLFFWAHSFQTEFMMLAVLLFVLGLILIGLEVFVMPGFGVTGISGVVLLVTSLVLVTLEKMPETSTDWNELGKNLAMFVSALLLAILFAFTLAWYLPHIPYANRLILPPPAEEAELDRDSAGGGPPQAPAALLGAIGEAATPLRPAGKARFGDDYLDVISEGDYINPGARIQVIEIEGNRIVVKEV
jgi:membrane-bound ClpP family serine protease